MRPCGKARFPRRALVHLRVDRLAGTVLDLAPLLLDQRSDVVGSGT